MIDEASVMCISETRMNYDSFHIKQTYLVQKSITCAEYIDSITNWCASQSALDSKVQIRYWRSFKADISVGLLSVIDSMLSSESGLLVHKKRSFGLFYARFTRWKITLSAFERRSQTLSLKSFILKSKKSFAAERKNIFIGVRSNLSDICSLNEYMSLLSLY